MRTSWRLCEISAWSGCENVAPAQELRVHIHKLRNGSVSTLGQVSSARGSRVEISRAYRAVTTLESYQSMCQICEALFESRTCVPLWEPATWLRLDDFFMEKGSSRCDKQVWPVVHIKSRKFCSDMLQKAKVVISWMRCLGSESDGSMMPSSVDAGQASQSLGSKVGLGSWER